MAEETKQPAATKASQEEPIVVPEKFKSIVDVIEKMSVLD